MLTSVRVAAAIFALLTVPVFAQTPSQGTTQVPAHPALPGRPTVTPPIPPSQPAALSTPPAAGQGGGKLDINTASEEQLDTLPGIGPARAKAIIANRPYTDLQDLVGKKVLPQNVYDGAKPRMALANINTASASDLAKTLPGIGDARSNQIVAGRPYRSPQDLVTKGILTQPVFDKIKELVIN